MGIIKDFMKKMKNMKRKLNNSLFEKQGKIEYNLSNTDEFFPQRIMNKANEEHRRKAAPKQSNQVHVDQYQGNAWQNQRVPMNAWQNQRVPMNAWQNQGVLMNARQNQGVLMNAWQNQGSSANDVPNRVYSNRLELEFKHFTKNQEKFIDVVSHVNNNIYKKIIDNKINRYESEEQGPIPLPLLEEMSHLSSRGYEVENYDSSDIESYDDERLENYRKNLKANTKYKINNSPKINGPKIK
ncbi:MAG: hypothetical protein K5769_10205 [Pseudobutyrivibrio sp.]|nr:hypothetical protein [Pseudobutyrivibrio sp.]